MSNFYPWAVAYFPLLLSVEIMDSIPWNVAWSINSLNLSRDVRTFFAKKKNRNSLFHVAFYPRVSTSVKMLKCQTEIGIKIRIHLHNTDILYFSLNKKKTQRTHIFANGIREHVGQTNRRNSLIFFKKTRNKLEKY